jgi:hypothetical protein
MMKKLGKAKLNVEELDLSNINNVSIKLNYYARF